MTTELWWAVTWKPELISCVAFADILSSHQKNSKETRYCVHNHMYKILYLNKEFNYFICAYHCSLPLKSFWSIYFNVNYLIYKSTVVQWIAQHIDVTFAFSKLSVQKKTYGSDLYVLLGNLKNIGFSQYCFIRKCIIWLRDKAGTQLQVWVLNCALSQQSSQ